MFSVFIAGKLWVDNVLHTKFLSSETVTPTSPHVQLHLPEGDRLGKSSVSHIFISACGQSLPTRYMYRNDIETV